jgi:hypothetical protein
MEQRRPRYVRESAHFAILSGSCQIGTGIRVASKLLIKSTKIVFPIDYGQLWSK